MTRAIDIADALGRLERLVGRTHETTDGDLARSYARLGALDGAGVFVTSFAGSSEWERHPSGDELVQVVDGETELTILADPPITLALRAGMFAVVPRGHWHRFRAPDGVSTLTVTPPPTDHHHSEDPPPAGIARRG